MIQGGSSPSPKSDSASAVKSGVKKKRVSRACDECRLHKARCDGMKLCDTCYRYDRVCSYNLLPRECKGPAARIRILEHRLVKANECIVELQRRVSHESVNDTASTLSIPTELSIVPKRSVLSQHGASTAMNLRIPLLESLLGLFPGDKEIEDLSHSQLIRSIFQNTATSGDITSKGFCHLPTYEIALELTYAAFNNTFGLYSIVAEQPFHESVRKLYDPNSTTHSQEDTEFVLLLYAVIALGMIHHWQTQPGLSYEEAVHKSSLYFEAAMSAFITNDDCPSISNLQIRLCLVLYCVNTSKFNLARPTLRLICGCPLFVNLLQKVATQGNQDPRLLDSRAKDIVWVVFYVDMHMSYLTDVPPLLTSPGSEIATVHAINTAAHNVANYKRSSSTFLLSVSLAMAIELMKSIPVDTGGISTTQLQRPSTLFSQPTTPTDSQGWRELQTKIDTWGHMLQRIFPEDDSNPQILFARDELQMYLYQAQIVLYHKSLHCFSQSANILGFNHHGIDEMNRREACIVAATNAISYTSTRLAQRSASTLTWSSAYTVFISGIILLIAVSSTDTDIYHNTIANSIQILQNTTYGNSHNKQTYLEIIQALSIKVMPLRLNSLPFHHSPFPPDLSPSSGYHTSSQMINPTSETMVSPEGYSAHNEDWVTHTAVAEAGGWGFDG